MAKKDSQLLLTGGVVRRLKPPATGNKIYYDRELPGFGARITCNGARSYILNYHIHGRERRYTIGDAGTWTTTNARREARRLKHSIDRGHDPLSDREAERTAPTVVDLLDRFEQEHLPRKRDSTAADYKRMLRVHIRPHFGNHAKVQDIRFADVDSLHRKISKASPRRANTVIAVLSKAFNLAIRWGMRPDGTNPAKSIERNIETQRRRYLRNGELPALLKALAEYPDRQTADVFRLLLLTGSRRGEVLGAKWSDIDLGVGTWSKPASSVKQKQDHAIPLSAPARQLLSEIRERQLAGKRTLPEHVFPGRGNTDHVVEVKRAWKAICKTAHLSDLRVHDLRHSFASELVNTGSSLPLIGALLGHSNPATTARYSHLYDDALRQATERVGAAVEAAANGNGKPASPPVDLATAKRGRGRHGR
jgi:integrase